MVIGSSVRPEERLLLSGDEAGTAPEDRKFRPDVQGLRAVAVMLVVLFHARVPGLGGGYVGVDVFFVISGFVITGVLLRERTSTGSTSILSFYGRRVRRILPAATFVIIAAVVASYFLVGPLSGNQTAGDARWASVFLINLHFATGGTNYLASNLPPSVLQNYWSLAVEEQFYLIYPTIFLVVAGLSSRLSLRHRLGIVLSIAVIVSFVTSVVQTSNNATAAYFSPLPRVWELALGGLVAISTIHLRHLPALMASVLSWIGLASILLAAFVFSAATPYPGWVVALPVVGAALVIAAGVATPAHGTERLLGLRPFQLLGLVSYSLYLWHWPVLTLATERSSAGSLPVSDALLWVLLSLALAILTYLLIENPVRHSVILIDKRWASLALGACLIAASLTVATVELHLHDTGPLATPGLANLKSGDACPPPTRQELRPLMGTGLTANHPIQATILLVGDSTACTMLPGLQAVAAPVGVRVEDGAVIGCGVVSDQIAPSFVDGVNVNSASRSCQTRAAATELRGLHSGHPNVVLWASSWEREALLVGNGVGQDVLEQGSPRWYSVLLNRMKERVQRFTEAGATVVMLTQPPFVPAGTPTGPTPQDEDFERLNALMTDFAAHTPHVRVIDLATHVCRSGPPCPILVDNVWVRGDGKHYSSVGSLWVARWLLPQLGIGALDEPTNPLPEIKVVGLANGTVVKGTRPLASVSAFNLGGIKVEFQVTGRGLKDAVIGPAVSGYGYWGLYWNTRDVPNGTYVVRSVAYNSVGARSVSQGITVRVANRSDT
jgi:peptidoglycan/LPS O-acetylase OafA/YrhL